MLDVKQKMCIKTEKQNERNIKMGKKAIETELEACKHFQCIYYKLIPSHQMVVSALSKQKCCHLGSIRQRKKKYVVNSNCRLLSVISSYFVNQLLISIFIEM